MCGDRDGQVSSRLSGGWRPVRWLGVAAGLAGALTVESAWAQAGAAEAASASKLTVQVREVAATARRVRVTLGKSLLIETNIPVRRASVACPDIAEVVVLSPKQLLVTGKAFGSTQLILWTKDSQRELFDLTVQIETARLEEAIRRAAPRARVRVQPVLDTLVLSGAVPNPAVAERIVQLAGIYCGKVQNQMQVAGVQQVLLRCTVAEVNKRALRQLGVNGWLAGDHFQDAFFVQQIGGINPAVIGAVGATNVQGTIPFATFGPQAIVNESSGIPITGATTFSVGFPRVQMQLFIQALRENGLLRILAEPNLVAISGQTASFLAGGEFPVPIPQDQNTITIEFKEFGVRLNFTPTVVGGQIVRLRVAPEVSEPDFTSAVQFAGFVIPGLTQRKAETTVEVGNGQTVAIAGLLSEQVRGIARKIPGLGDIPVLGALFSSVEYQKSQTELVILVTPELVEAMNPDQLTAAIPGELMADPNDFELFGLGLLEGRRGGEAPGQAGPTTQPVAGPRSSGTAAWLQGPWGPADFEEAD